MEELVKDINNLSNNVLNINRLIYENKKMLRNTDFDSSIVNNRINKLKGIRKDIAESASCILGQLHRVCERKDTHWTEACCYNWKIYDLIVSYKAVVAFLESRVKGISFSIREHGGM